MPSTILPIQATRGDALRPAAGLRFGNFENMVYLPPIKQPSALGPHSLASLNNSQICKTVCEWVDAWQPWQQKALLCSIVNRSTLPQLQILATTLEPLRHHGPPITSRPRPTTGLSMSSAKSSRSRFTATPLPLLTSSHPSSPPRQQQKDSDPDFQNCQRKFAKRKEEDKLDEYAATISAAVLGAVFQEISTEGGTAGPSHEDVETNLGAWTLDQYASVVSSSVLVTAYSEISMADKLDQIMKQEMNLSAENLTHKEEKLLESFVASKQGSQDLQECKKSSIDESPEQKNNLTASAHSVRPGILRTASEKRGEQSATASAQFLGGRISFTPGSRQGCASGSRRSGSSRYRRSAFASSSASTPDFFPRERFPTLGPMQRVLRTGPVQRPVAVGDVPVPVQRFYKNRRFWPAAPTDSLQLQSAHKQELVANFRHQLNAVYQWLDQWESYERLSLVKEVVKLCDASVLEALVFHIHQKLRDACDINRLPDKLLLYVLSYLPASDIWQAAQVCRRWRYLCAMDDLWIVKCLELGEEEGVENVPQLIEEANTSDMDVDWMRAYVELQQLVTQVTSLSAQPHTENLPEESSKENADFSEKGLPNRFRIRRRGVQSNKLNATSNVDDMHQQESEEGSGMRQQKAGEAIDDKTSDIESALYQEELSALMRKDSVEDLQPKHSRKNPDWSRRRRTTNSEANRGTGDAKSSSPSSIADRQGSSTVVEEKQKQKRAARGEEEEEAVLDIHTDLTQSRDILGRIVPATSLEWKTPEHDEDFVRYPVYAGALAPIQRVRKVQGHLGGIQCLQFDVRRLLTGGTDHCLRLWDVRTSRSIHKFYGHKGGIRCVKFDDDILVTGSWDCTVIVWDIRHFSQEAHLHGHENSVSSLQILKHYILSGSHDHTVRVWSRSTYTCSQVLTGHSGPVLSLQADDQYLYSSASDMTIRKTNLTTWICEDVFERVNTSPIYCLKLTGALLLGGDGEGKVFFWNTGTCEAEAGVKVHEAAINSVDFHKGRFYTGSSDGTMSEYDLATMTCLRVLRGHQGPVRGIQVSARRFVSCSDDGSARIWDLTTGKTSKTVPTSSSAEDSAPAIASSARISSKMSKSPSNRSKPSAVKSTSRWMKSP